MHALRPLAARLLLAIAAFAVSFAEAANSLAPPPSAPATVRILIWEEFLSPKIIKTLKNRHGLVVEQLTFSNAAERDALLAKHKGAIDLVVADSSYIGEYRRRGLLQPIDRTRLPALKHVMSRWQQDTDYAVPYLWGHTGIAWRTDLVKKPVKTYADLLALARQQPGKVSLLDDTHEALRAALYASGKPPFRMSTPEQVAAAAKLLAQHWSGVRFVGSELGDDAPLVTGEVIAAQSYNGDIAYLRDTYKLPIAFAIPSPGCMIWQEHFALLKNAPAPAAAYRFLDAINNPINAARNATDVRYATSNVLAVEHLPEAFRNDVIIRPTFSGLGDCYFYEAFEVTTQAALDAVKLGN